MNELSTIRADSETAVASRSGFSASEFMEIAPRIMALEAGQVELVGGKIERMAPALSQHSYYHSLLHGLLLSAYDPHQHWIGIDLGVQTADQTVRGVDLAVVSGSEPEPGLVSPDRLVLLVEISATTLARDLVDKASEYAGLRVGEYWVVDLAARAVHVMKDPGEDGYASRSLVRFDEPLTAPVTGRNFTISKPV